VTESASAPASIDGGRMSKSSSFEFRTWLVPPVLLPIFLSLVIAAAVLYNLSPAWRGRVSSSLWCGSVDQVSPNKIYRFDQTPSARMARLRKEACGTPPGVRRDELLRRAQQIDDDSSKGRW